MDLHVCRDAMGRIMKEHEIAPPLPGANPAPTMNVIEIIDQPLKHWSGVTKRVHLRDEQNHFVGNFIEDTASMAWSAEEEGFKFVSDPADTSTSIFAEIGSERNGVFFNNNED